MRSLAQSLTITLMALVMSLILFAVFVFCYTGLFGSAVITPSRLYTEMWAGSFGSEPSWQNTLTRAAPLILTALCTALPARLGLVVIGAEGALALGALAAVSVGLKLEQIDVGLAQWGMMIAGMLAGGALIALVGLLSHGRGVNATISSLLIAYAGIGVFNFIVEDPRLMRDPASLNKPSTYPIADETMIGTIKDKIEGPATWVDSFFTREADEAGPVVRNIGFLDVHWGLGFGVLACIVSYILLDHTRFGFGARLAGGNMRAAQAVGLPVGVLIVATCFLGGAFAGLAGSVEIAAVHKQASASVLAGYGFMGILVSFIARHHPLGIIPAAVLFGGLSAASGILQRRLNLPDASVQVLMGIIFVMILLFETLYGRFRVFWPREVREAAKA